MPEFNIRKELTHIRHYLDLLKQSGRQQAKETSEAEKNSKKG